MTSRKTASPFTYCWGRESTLRRILPPFPSPQGKVKLSLQRDERENFLGQSKGRKGTFYVSLSAPASQRQHDFGDRMLSVSLLITGHCFSRRSEKPGAFQGSVSLERRETKQGLSPLKQRTDSRTHWIEFIVLTSSRPELLIRTKGDRVLGIFPIPFFTTSIK